jgi:hypothetical protein
MTTEVAVRRKIFLALSLLLAHFPLVSQADCFSVVWENTNGVHVPGTTLNYLIGIENANESSDLLVLWDLNLTITPASTQTTGNLFIANAYQPHENYLLDGITSGLEPSFNGPANSINQIGDMDGQLIGVSVPKKGKYLLELDLQATDDAQGLFNIEIQPQETSAYWATTDDILADPPKSRAFDNLPFESSAPITIGTVKIQNVPEPSSIAVLSVGIFCFLIHWLRSDMLKWMRFMT